jgi:hypothetical protein
VHRDERRVGRDDGQDCLLVLGSRGRCGPAATSGRASRCCRCECVESSCCPTLVPRGASVVGSVITLMGDSAPGGDELAQIAVRGGFSSSIPSTHASGAPPCALAWGRVRVAVRTRWGPSGSWWGDEVSGRRGLRLPPNAGCGPRTRLLVGQRPVFWGPGVVRNARDLMSRRSNTCRVLQEIERAGILDLHLLQFYDDALTCVMPSTSTELFSLSSSGPHPPWSEASNPRARLSEHKGSEQCSGPQSVFLRGPRSSPQCSPQAPQRGPWPLLSVLPTADC